jgi:putative phosphoesterase
MKIGVISDTHIPERAKSVPAKVLEAFQGLDMVIHAGDFVDIRVAESLRTVCPNLKGVSGNMDSEAIRTQFPEKETIAVGAHRSQTRVRAAEQAAPAYAGSF